jgi:hypothetical protein
VPGEGARQVQLNLCAKQQPAHYIIQFKQSQSINAPRTLLNLRAYMPAGSAQLQHKARKGRVQHSTAADVNVLLRVRMCGVAACEQRAVQDGWLVRSANKRQRMTLKAVLLLMRHLLECTRAAVSLVEAPQ